MTDTLDAVRRYLNEGWQVIPIPRGEKGPRIPNWQHTIFTLEAFHPSDNIGVRLGDVSNGLTDVDLDCPEAVAAAPFLLLETGRIHGRASKPRSHYWYISPGVLSFQFKDLDGSMLVELRADSSSQTVLPPSVHPSKEVYTWEADRELNRVDPEGLFASVRLVSVTALLARHWPSAGSRHEVAGLVAGALAYLKCSGPEIERVIEHAAKLAGDEGVDDRVRYARDTFRDFSAGNRVAGAPRLAELVGPELVRRIKAWFSEGREGNLLEELNEKHAVIFQQSGDLVIITEDRDHDGRPFLRFSSADVIRQLYPQLVKVGENSKGQAIRKPLGEYWLKNPARRFYNGIELAPNGHNTPGYYNIWRGFAVEPKQGHWGLFQKHVLEIIARNNEDIYEYVISWMAKAVQKPGEQANTAIALRGGQGTGKGAFVRGFGALFGVHFIHLDSTRHLTGNFNAHLHNAILVFADEAAWPGDKAGLGALKRLITEPTLSIERKGLDIFTVPNTVHLMMASNEDWMVPAAIGERRFVVLDVDTKRQNDTKYFAALEDELFKDGGLAAMLFDLMNFKIRIDLRIIPKTEALFQQKQITANAQRRWWFQVLYDGDIWTNEVPREPGEFRVNRDKLYEDYASTLDKAGYRLKNIQTELGIFLKKVMPDPFPKTYRARKVDGTWGDREWVFPSLHTCRRFFELEHDVPGAMSWPEEVNDAINIQTSKDQIDFL
jgi:hypothetical protein